MSAVQFFEYLAEHDTSRQLGRALAGIYAARKATRAAATRHEACLAGASPTAA